jgi:hypothetical protein
VCSDICFSLVCLLLYAPPYYVHVACLVISNSIAELRNTVAGVKKDVTAQVTVTAYFVTAILVTVMIVQSCVYCIFVLL